MTPAERHRAKMKAKKARNATMTAGFTPIRNAKIESAVQAAIMFAQVRNPKLTPIEAHEQGWRDVARTLPAGRGDKYRIRPSKSDSPAYRKAA